MLGRHSTIELHPRPKSNTLIQGKELQVWNYTGQGFKSQIDPLLMDSFMIGSRELFAWAASNHNPPDLVLLSK
jgi:hypothetical protein